MRLAWLLVLASLSSAHLDDPKLGAFDDANRNARAATTTTTTTKSPLSDQPNCEAVHESYDLDSNSVAREFKEYAITVDNEICATEGK